MIHMVKNVGQFGLSEPTYLCVAFGVNEKDVIDDT